MYCLATSYQSTKDYVFHPKLVISTCRFYRYYHRKTCFEGFSKKKSNKYYKYTQDYSVTRSNHLQLWTRLWHDDTMTLWHSLELEETTANWEIPRYCDVEYRDQRPNLQSSQHVMQTVSVGEMLYQSGIPQFRYFSSI